MKRIFELKPEHIKLLRHFQVNWQDDETGAPEIDPKRPYGNSSVWNDIHEILTGETIGLTNSKRDELTDSEIHTYMKLHRETDVALQIVLVTGIFEPGIYECNKYFRDWTKIADYF